MRVLEIGANVLAKAHLAFPDAEVDYLEAFEDAPRDPVMDGKKVIIGDARYLTAALNGNKYDAILASHVLEHCVWWDVDRVLSEWADCLTDDGALHIIVPSLEWAARQILSEKPSKATLPHLYSDWASPWNIHGTGFTMRLLRSKLERAGLAVVTARTVPYKLTVGDQILEADEHYAVGVKGIRPLRKE